MTGKQYQIIVQDFVMDIPTRTKKNIGIELFNCPLTVACKNRKIFFGQLKELIATTGERESV